MPGKAPRWIYERRCVPTPVNTLYCHFTILASLGLIVASMLTGAGTAEFWLIFLCFCIVGGTGLLVNANIAQIAQALLVGSDEDQSDRVLHCKYVAQQQAGPSFLAVGLAAAGKEGATEVSYDAGEVGEVTAAECVRVSTEGSQQLLVTLFSNGNFLGRTVCGMLSDSFADRLPVRETTLGPGHFSARLLSHR